MTDLKTVLVDALHSAVQKDREEFFSDEDADLGADRLATALHAIVYDREKVRAALLNACANEGVICGDGPDEPLIIERTIDDEFIDRLIAGLSGGSE